MSAVDEIELETRIFAALLEAVPTTSSGPVALALGFHLGLIAAMRHPEWVQAVQERIFGEAAANVLADRVVRHVPLEVLS